MSSEVYSGISKAFVGNRLFTAAEIEAAMHATAPAIPAGTGTGKMNWKQIMYDRDVELMIPRKVFRQRTAPEGTRKITQDEDDGPELTLDLNDISLAHLLGMLALGHDPTGAAAAQRIKSNYGRDLTLIGKPILLYHAEYDFSNVSDTPKIGPGTGTVSEENLGTQSGITDNFSVILGSSASSSNDAYNGQKIDITVGTLTMTRTIVDYIGSTKKAILNSPLNVDPSGSDTYKVYAASDGADPKACLLFNCVVMEDIKVPYKKNQQIIPVKFGTCAVDGTSDDNLAVFGAFPLDLSASTTVDA